MSSSLLRRSLKPASRLLSAAVFAPATTTTTNNHVLSLAAAHKFLHASSHAQMAVESMPVKEQLRAVAPAQAKQADTGAGSQPIISKPAPEPGTIEVKIDGKESPAALAIKEGKKPHYRDAVPRTDENWTLNHPLWMHEYVEQVKYTHLPPTDLKDKLALWTIKAIRFNFDWMSGYSFGPMTVKKAITRMVFLETVAGVPGSIGAMIRHLASLRRMKRDHGWIMTLFAEAENERMHLLVALEVRQPGPFMKSMVFLTQGIFFNFFFAAYLVSPQFCHRLVGYLEEEAVVTYTHILNDIEKGGNLAPWKTMPAPQIAQKYWGLPENASMRDVIAHIRADEAHHRDTNHHLGSIPQDALNPFRTKIS